MAATVARRLFAPVRRAIRRGIRRNARHGIQPALARRARPPGPPDERSGRSSAPPAHRPRATAPRVTPYARRFQANRPSDLYWVFSRKEQLAMRFEGSSQYVATDDLKLAVNAAMTLKRPLLIKGEPGTGKTMLAEEVAAALGMPLLQWHIKSTTKGQQGLYEYDAVSRLRDSQLGDERVKDIRNYIVKGVLWQAFESDEQTVLLIDEIDKADIEFPNDLLRELDRMEFYVYETHELIRAKQRPLVIITSNNEKELPDAFLRRCFFHYIKFPDPATMQQIVEVHYPGIKKDLLAAAMQSFFELRNVAGLKKKPSTSELLDWLKLLLAEDIPPEALRSSDQKQIIPPLHGALLKNEQDVSLFERLIFMNRNNR
jgi:MoxR-like ATPase